MKNYNIIASPDIVENFIKWLPDLKEDETYYCCLFARKKYDTTGVLKSDKSQLKRFTSNKEFLFDKIKQLECEVGSYKFKNIIVPDESLALYISINPRSFTVAARESLIDLARAVTKPYDGYNPHQIVMSNIQTSCGTKKYIDFDFDGISIAEIKERIELNDIINLDALTFLKTRGGFHLLVETSKIKYEHQKSWYNGISKLPNVDVRGDNLVPFPGCYQGGFVPHIVESI